MAELFIALPSLAVTPPTISPGYGCYATAQVVEMAAPAGVIHYTLNGTTPDASSPVYSSGFVITGTTTVKAVAIDSSVSSSVATAYLEIDAETSRVLRNGLALWLKSDNGLSTSGSNVTSWLNLMSGNLASQSSASDQPTFVSNAVNGHPAVAFDGASDYLSLPADFSSIYTTCIFIVSKPSTVSNGVPILHLSNGTNNTNSVSMTEQSANGLKFQVYNGSSPTSLSSSGTIAANQYQILESCVDGVGNARIFSNGTLRASGSMTTATSGYQNTNFLGSDLSLSSYFEGEVAEVLIYAGNPLMSETDRQKVEGYLLNRYGVVGPAPTISPRAAVFPTPGGDNTSTERQMSPIEITSLDYGATLKYTLDGSVPTSSSTTYSGPFYVSNDSQVRAIAVRPYGNSDVSETSYIQVQPSASSVPRDKLYLWLKSDHGVFSSAGSLTKWIDMSGTTTAAEQSSSASRPAVLTDQINGLPAINFNGSNQYLNLPNGFKNFNSGLSMFVVTAPSNSTAGKILELSNGAANNISLSTNGNSATTTTYGFASSSITATSAITLNQFQLLEALQASFSGTLAVNTVDLTSGTLQDPPNIERSQNTLGCNYDATGEFFQGKIAEMLVYGRNLTQSERANLESYLITRYLLNNVVPTAPILSESTGNFGEPLDVQISGRTGCKIYFTIDGTSPTSSSTEYVAPIRVSYTTVLKAICIKDGVSSAVSQATYTLDATRWPAPSPSDSRPLDFQIKLPSTSLPQ